MRRRRRMGLAVSATAARAAEVEVEAPPAACLAVIADVESYPDWAPGYRFVEVERHDAAGRPVVVAYGVGGFGTRATYRLSYSYADDPPTVEFHQLEGSVTESIRGRYTLEETERGTLVRYEAQVVLALRVPGPLQRAAERIVMSAALDGLAREVGRRRGPVSG